MVKKLIHKVSPLTGKEMRFMRKFLELSTTEFGSKLGVSHVTVVKWENEQAKIAPAQETYSGGRVALLDGMLISYTIFYELQ